MPAGKAADSIYDMKFREICKEPLDNYAEVY